MHRAARLFVTLLLTVPPAARTHAQERPNILVIVADDMGYADIGVHGSRDIPTPHIDALAQRGIRFTDAYVSGPYCSPTRAGLLTGRYPQRFGHEFNPWQGDHGMPLDQRTLADHLKAAGYRTALVGKWHLGRAPGMHPLDRGFDEFFGFLGAAHSYLEVQDGVANPVLDGRDPVAEIGYLTEDLARRAVAFIRRPDAQPFFLYLAFNAVHTPMHATGAHLERHAGIADERRRTYAAMLSAMDDGIGSVLEALRAAGMEENTLIFFFSDNGGPTMVGTSVNGSSNAPLRGSKRQTWEGGIRVPFVISWKGHLAEGAVDSRPIIQLDVLPTALAAAGIAVKPEWQLDGVDLLPFLTGARPDRPHDLLFWRMGEHMAVRRGDWKLVRSPNGRLNGQSPGDLADAGLYDLAHDMAEQHDRAADHPDIARELAAAWQRWNRELPAPGWLPNPRPPPMP